MGLGESIEGKGGDGENDLFLSLAADPALGHAATQLRLQHLHTLGRALEPHGAAQILGLAP